MRQFLLVLLNVLEICGHNWSQSSIQVPSLPESVNAFSLPLYFRKSRRADIHGTTQERRGISSLQAVGFGHGSYFTTISLGGVNLQVAIDTGSADLWVVSSTCTSFICASIPKYPLSFQSHTFIPVNDNNTVFNISYADHTSASGFIALETLRIGNATVPSQSLAFVNTTNVTLHDRVSGVLGLSFSRLSVISQALSADQAPSVISHMASQGILTYPLFGLSLPSVEGDGGSLTLGAVDISIVRNTSRISWHPVVPFASPFNQQNSSIYLNWALALSKMNIGGLDLNLQPTYPRITTKSVALLDVGANGIFGPYQDVSRVFELLDPDSRAVGDGQWVVPCATNATMTFTFGTQNILLHPRDYIIGPTSGDDSLCIAWPQASPPSVDGIDWQLGTPFLRAVYSVFSFGIDKNEPPMIGLLSLNATDYSPSSVTRSSSSLVDATHTLPVTSTSSTFSATTTIQTTLPNVPISTPLLTTPPYGFNTSAGIPTQGQRAATGLATQTYSPILLPLNASAIPVISPNETVQTFLITDSAGNVHTETTTTTSPTPSVKLGAPPGSNAARRRVFYSPFQLYLALIVTVSWTCL